MRSFSARIILVTATLLVYIQTSQALPSERIRSSLTVGKRQSICGDANAIPGDVCNSGTPCPTGGGYISTDGVPPLPRSPLYTLCHRKRNVGKHLIIVVTSSRLSSDRRFFAYHEQFQWRDCRRHLLLSVDDDTAH